MQTEEIRIVIPPPSYSFTILNLFTLALFYVKIDKNWYLQWWIVFSPTSLFFTYKSLAAVYHCRMI